MNSKLLFFYITLYFLGLVHSKALLDAKKYLFQYGYLNSLDANETTFKNALKQYQNAFDLAATGEVNEETLAVMSKRRCGRPDNVLPFAATEDKWKKKHLTYQIQNWTEPFTKSVLKEIIENAITHWTKDCDLVITESSSDKSDINIYFTKQDGRYNILGYAFFPENGNMYLDEDENWTVNKPTDDTQTYFSWVAGHEMGHSLGLRHSETRRSIMFPYYSTKVTEPSELDNSNLKALYKTRIEYNNSILCKDPKVDGLVKSTKNQQILFKGNQYWLFSTEGLRTGPFSLNYTYPDLPESIDCAFSIGKSTYIFKDNVFYKYKSNKKTYRRKLISIGFDNLPSNLDAAFFHPEKSIIYFFKGDKFYEFYFKKSIGKRLNLDGANISKVWIGVPVNIEAATMFDNNMVLFIKKSRCYVFDLKSKAVVDEKDCRKKLFNC